MPVQALAQADCNQFCNLPLNTAGTSRSGTQVSGVAVSNDFSGRLSVTTVEGDTITLTADIESDFRAVNYRSRIESGDTAVDVRAKYAAYTLRKEFGVTVEGDLNEQELQDLETLFRKVSNIFRKFFRGQDEDALAKTAKLAERFDNMSSLSSLELNVDVERSVTVLAAQIASEARGPHPVATSQQPQPSSTGSSTVTPGGAPATSAVIPPPSTGTTAPTPPAVPASSTESIGAVRVSVPGQGTAQPLTLVQQVLDAIKDAHVESRNIRKYLPGFFERLREDLGRELQSKREDMAADHNQPLNHGQIPTTAYSSFASAYQVVRQTSVSLSVQT